MRRYAFETLSQHNGSVFILYFCKNEDITTLFFRDTGGFFRQTRQFFIPLSQTSSVCWQIYRQASGIKCKNLRPAKPESHLKSPKISCWKYAPYTMRLSGNGCFSRSLRQTHPATAGLKILNGFMRLIRLKRIVFLDLAKISHSRTASRDMALDRNRIRTFMPLEI